MTEPYTHAEWMRLSPEERLESGDGHRLPQERTFTSSLCGSATSVTLSWWQEDVTVSVGMQVRNLEAATEIIQRSRELDDENIGEHKDKYTLHEAIVNVLHFDPTYLFDRLGGWWETA